AATPERLLNEGYAHIVVATGIRPRIPDLPGVDHPKVVSYLDLIEGKVTAGTRVAIIGTGGIAHDVAELLTHPGAGEEDIDEFLSYWGVDTAISEPGGLAAAAAEQTPREVLMFQRSTSRPGSRLGKSTGWIHRTRLNRRGVKAVAGCSYQRIDDAGLHYWLDG